MSQRFGRDPEYTRGGGGNSSVKAGGVVYIKPSGVPLATLEADWHAVYPVDKPFSVHLAPYADEDPWEPAIEDRWGRPGRELTDRAQVWDLEATYLAQALRSFTYVVAPQRIVIGGGVMQQPGLIELVRVKLGEQLGGYATSEIRAGNLDDYVVAPEFGQDAGLIGAIALAMQAYEAG